jgi:hypothetical protein
MSLNWNISNVENWKEKQEKHHDVLNFIVWQSLCIGMGKLTKSNVDEWYYRIQRNRLEGGYGLSPITKEELMIWIGLYTNVSTITAKEYDKVLKERYPGRYGMTRRELDA